MNPARILFVIGSMSGGGSERRMADLLQRLDRTRFAPELYLSYRTGELLHEVPDDVPIHAFVDGPREQTLWQRLAGKFRILSEARALDLRRLLKRRKYDLIFAWGLRRAYETAGPARSAGVPRMTYCVQDPVVELQVDFPHPTPWRWNAARWSYLTGSRLCANSADLCRRLEDFYRLPKSSVELFRNLRDFGRLDRLAKEAAPAWQVSGTRLVCVGRLERQKGHALLLDAVAELVHHRRRDIQVTIVGQGSLETELKRQADRLHIGDRVRWAGFQPNPYPYFREADICVMPSLWEGLPNVLIEALAFGVPVVAADCPTGPREILENGRLGKLVPTGDITALADAIEHIGAHLPEAQATARAAQAEVRAKYEIGLGISELEQRFLDVIAAASEARGRK